MSWIPAVRENPWSQWELHEVLEMREEELDVRWAEIMVHIDIYHGYEAGAVEKTWQDS